MIVVDCQQGEPAWIAARLGVLTATGAEYVVTPRQLKASATAPKYRATLLAEWIQGAPDEDFGGSFWTERGHAYEGEARAFFSFATGLNVQSVGFVYRDEARDCGCSPDGLVVSAHDRRVQARRLGGLELKVPKLKTHLYYRDQGALPREYTMQIQFSLWVTGLPRWWFMSYSPIPNVPPVLIEVEPDERTQDALSEHVPPFLKQLAAAKDKLLDEGVEPMDPADALGAGEWEPMTEATD